MRGWVVGTKKRSDSIRQIWAKRKIFRKQRSKGYRSSIGLSFMGESHQTQYPTKHFSPLFFFFLHPHAFLRNHLWRVVKPGQVRSVNQLGQMGEQPYMSLCRIQTTSHFYVSFYAPSITIYHTFISLLL